MQPAPPRRGAHRPPQATPHPAKPEWSRAIAPDPVLLFRYSALTFNAHRIHYDLPIPGHRGLSRLVMNGGLTALLLVETARAHLPAAHCGLRRARACIRCLSARALRSMDASSGEAGRALGVRSGRHPRLPGQCAARAAPMTGGPLAGIRVVDLTSVRRRPDRDAVPRRLRAEVIKVESPAGDLLRRLGGRSKSGQLSRQVHPFQPQQALARARPQAGEGARGA